MPNDLYVEYGGKPVEVDLRGTRKLSEVRQRIGEALDADPSRVRLFTNTKHELTECIRVPNDVSMLALELLPDPLEVAVARACSARVFQDLTGRHELNLRYRKLTALPKTFGNLSNVFTLDIASNQLSRLPDSFVELRQLQKLDLHSNLLEALPDSFGKFDKLSELNLANNRLASCQKVSDSSHHCLS
jgi:hypothetical protein